MGMSQNWRAPPVDSRGEILETQAEADYQGKGRLPDEVPDCLLT